MGYLAPQSIYSRDLAKRRIWVRPPEPSARLLMDSSEDGIYLGRSRLMAVPVYWDFHHLTNPHLAVVGMTGSGKSYFIKAFITRAWRQWATSSLILDWAGEYTPWVEEAGGQVVSLGRGMGLNVLDCRPGKKTKFEEEEEGGKKKEAKSGKQKFESSSPYAHTPRFRIEQLVSSFKILGELDGHPRAARLLQEVLEDSFRKKRLPPEKPLTASTPASRLPTLRDALALLKKKAKRAKNDEELLLALSILEFFCPPGADYFSQKGGLRLDDLIGHGVVSVDFSGLPHEAHRSLAGLTILQMLKERMRQSGWSATRKLRLLVVADEAWKIAQDERSDLVAIVREGRKYAFGLIVASQNPTDLSKTIFSNAGTLMAFRLSLHEFRESLRQSLQLPQGLADELERLPVGSALTRLGWDKLDESAIPFMVSIEGEEPARPYVMKVGDMDIEIEREALRKRLWRLGLTDQQIGQVCETFERSDRTLAADEMARLLSGWGLSRTVILSFMRSLGVPEDQLVSLFSRLAARSMGVSPNKLVSIEVSDEPKKR
ncbi:Uncharacterised protein [uncultured archaeon]|nr:Uncharacterised protein [uncultured archaeon]